jgi:hypothetical protein
MFKVPNEYRLRNHPILASDDSYGNNGAFEIPLEGPIAFVIASDGQGWNHVSVHVMVDGESETPTWDEMCAIKDLFWDEEDCVVQYHPPKSQYVNQHEHTLHLWRPTIQSIPVPNHLLVGTKKK